MSKKFDAPETVPEDGSFARCPTWTQGAVNGPVHPKSEG